MKTFADLFTSRQLLALTTFSDLVGEARERVHADAIAAVHPWGVDVCTGVEAHAGRKDPRKLRAFVAAAKAAAPVDTPYPQTTDGPVAYDWQDD